ncbi:MAG: alpha-amylase family glycosyl hydrolase [Actinomycetota bacterium]|nr:alpha-amylase family glycosyl hydrolase [Actinomycetota bacterium]
MSPTVPWWVNAVVYQIYPRSFMDSDGDGIGDLAGIRSRLDYLAWLGVDAIWLSPIYPSPLADLGYDVADYCRVAPEYGTLADFDRLLTDAHRLGLRVLLDLVPSHTSIEHPWFREHPDRYMWADRPPNNWVSAFGGSAWARDRASGRYYLHSFYEEQPDLDWRNPDLREAFAEVVRFWLDRGVDGFRVDAVQQLLKDAKLRDDGVASGQAPLPFHPEFGRLDHSRSSNQPDVGIALSAIRAAAGDAFLVGEAYVPTSAMATYLDHLDATFCFELLHAPFEVEELQSAIHPALALKANAWALSNHDFPRIATRLGEPRAMMAAILLLTLPGPVFIYQGDEIAMVDGPGADPPFDRARRDPHRHPMQWDPEPAGGFTTGKPWLPLTDPLSRSVSRQRDSKGTPLDLYRELIALRPSIEGELEWNRELGARVLAYQRGRHLVVLNLGSQAVDPGSRWRPLLDTGSAGRGVGPEGGQVFLAD